jgi:hypothetical protein
VVKDQLLLTIIKKERRSIDQSVIIVLVDERKEYRFGKNQVTKRKPHVINAALLLNILNSLMYSTLTVIRQIVDIQILKLYAPTVSAYYINLNLRGSKAI